MNLNAKYYFKVKQIIFSVLILSFVSLTACAQTKNIVLGAERTDQYLKLLEGKKVGLVVNQTSMIAETHLVDSLLSSGIEVVKVFAPEHGFRGKLDAGEKVTSGIDPKTKLPIISLYGKHKKPYPEDLADLDVVVFDIQDVGTRFYTYISTMHYVMEACAEQNKMFVVLDRPNPNGMYVEGPVLDLANQSFVGMHPIPVLHGLTVAELASMINGEQWLSNGVKCNLVVIKMGEYTHNTSYQLPIKPSPNLPNTQSIQLYPSLCLFEGTTISVGRGTELPFQQIGHPTLKDEFTYNFTPISTEGAKYPPYEGQSCYGLDLSSSEQPEGFDISLLIKMYHAYSDKKTFFNDFFVKLAGVSELEEQIVAGFTKEEIELSWQAKLEAYKKKRESYLLYD